MGGSGWYLREVNDKRRLLTWEMGRAIELTCLLYTVLLASTNEFCHHDCLLYKYLSSTYRHQKITPSLQRMTAYDNSFGALQRLEDVAVCVASAFARFTCVVATCVCIRFTSVLGGFQPHKQSMQQLLCKTSKALAKTLKIHKSGRLYKILSKTSCANAKTR